MTKKKPVKKQVPRKKGRPTIYTPKVAALICSLLAEGQSLRKICSLDSMPRMSTVMQWLFNPSDFRESFVEQYRRARQMQAEIMADECIDIADDASEDEIITDEGKRMLNKEFVQRSKLRVETRQWTAVRLLPKVYGNKPEEKGDDGGSIAEAARIFAEAMARTQASADN